jgi:hypothetical protein
MTIEMDKLIKKHRNERNPEERAHLKTEMDQMPLSSGELDQVQQREHDRHETDVKTYREKRKQ